MAPFTEASVISIRLNGEAVQSSALTLADFVLDQGWQGKRIAVERNGRIVPKSLYSATPLCHNDTLEIVVAVGGG